MSNLKLEILSHLASEAVACSYCFMSDRAKEWGHVHQRPADRPDDVAFLPWIGPLYETARPRVVVMMLNPGHAADPHKCDRRDLGLQLGKGEISYDQYNSKLTASVPQWGRGAVVRWLRALNLEPETIAFLNVALCAVADDKYSKELFTTCFERHTRKLVATLEPDVVLLCGKKQLKPFVSSIELLGMKVILTSHYRPMYTGNGKAELRRVRAELDKLL